MLKFDSGGMPEPPRIQESTKTTGPEQKKRAPLQRGTPLSDSIYKKTAGEVSAPLSQNIQKETEHAKLQSGAHVVHTKAQATAPLNQGAEVETKETSKSQPRVFMKPTGKLPPPPTSLSTGLSSTLSSSSSSTAEGVSFTGKVVSTEEARRADAMHRVSKRGLGLSAAPGAVEHKEMASTTPRARAVPKEEEKDPNWLGEGANAVVRRNPETGKVEKRRKPTAIKSHEEMRAEFIKEVQLTNMTRERVQAAGLPLTGILKPATLIENRKNKEDFYIEQDEYTKPNFDNYAVELQEEINSGDPVRKVKAEIALLSIVKDVLIGMRSLEVVGIFPMDGKPENDLVHEDSRGNIEAAVGDVGGFLDFQVDLDNFEETKTFMKNLASVEPSPAFVNPKDVDALKKHIKEKLNLDFYNYFRKEIEQDVKSSNVYQEKIKNTSLDVQAQIAQEVCDHVLGDGGYERYKMFVESGGKRGDITDGKLKEINRLKELNIKTRGPVILEEQKEAVFQEVLQATVAEILGENFKIPDSVNKNVRYKDLLASFNETREICNKMIAYSTAVSFYLRMDVDLSEDKKHGDITELISFKTTDPRPVVIDRRLKTKRMPLALKEFIRCAVGVEGAMTSPITITRALERSKVLDVVEHELTVKQTELARLSQRGGMRYDSASLSQGLKQQEKEQKKMHRKQTITGAFSQSMGKEAVKDMKTIDLREKR